MYLLDTAIWAELRKPDDKIDPGVLTWSQSVSIEDQFMSAPTVWELDYGVRQVGQRDPGQGALLRSWLDALLKTLDNRVLPFSKEDALLCAGIPSPRAVRESMIAAAALNMKLKLVTRSEAAFSGIPGLAIINPWSA